LCTKRKIFQIANLKKKQFIIIRNLKLNKKITKSEKKLFMFNYTLCIITIVKSHFIIVSHEKIDITQEAKKKNEASKIQICMQM
jgi:hypothetical protein